MARIGFSAAALAAGLGVAGAAFAGAIGGPAEVVDGDGLRFGPVAVRLHGIDAPELGQKCAKPGGGKWDCGAAAADRLEQLVAGGEVRCAPLDRDGYGRVIARCEAGGVDLGAALAGEGLAWAFVRYSSDYVAEETAARTAKRGVWQAASEPPWEFRAERWAGAAQTAPRPDCPIKGNVNDEGERIYHTPWSPWYGKTKIDEAKGEAWFCDEAEALAAGWRPARFRG
ncbi:thermonuclease family protein [uncultured Amaricoccus sp.]|mgnify:CR=1 FL=1|uniref:thermonuclease family protein n=1 Tax=uncultured Amaricoccus sp. TaxID=339341 RepID=UPI002619FE91|nr:thermonuclease family protein [uncultured Amaricoccus sp.]